MLRIWFAWVPFLKLDSLSALTVPSSHCLSYLRALIEVVSWVFVVCVAGAGAGWAAFGLSACAIS